MERNIAHIGKKIDRKGETWATTAFTHRMKYDYLKVNYFLPYHIGRAGLMIPFYTIR